MKKALVFLLIAILILATSCVTKTNVKRISDVKDIDLSGNWNDTDIRMVTSELVNGCLSSNWIGNFNRENHRVPVIIVGNVSNQSSEHIDTSIISAALERALLESGKASSVASVDNRQDVMDEREHQQYFASQETAAKLGKELGADYLLQGSVKTNLDQISGESVRTYYVSLELIDIETSQKVWLDESTVRKYVTQKKYIL